VPSTRVIPVDPDEPDPLAVAEAAEVLRGGGLVAFATETVYGLGADATDPRAVARIFEAKGRPSTNPLIVHVESKQAALACVADWPARADILADRFWPGPLTLVLPRSPIIPDTVTAGHDTVGVRVPRPRAARDLIRAAGRPIAAPSANRSTGVSPTHAEHVLKDLGGKVDLILDSGWTSIGLESSVLDLSGPRPTVLRPGQITQEVLARTLGESVDRLESPVEASEFRSPGQMSIHYAPRKPAYRVDRERFLSHPVGGRYLLISIGPLPEPWPSGPARHTAHIRLRSPSSAAQSLYNHFHSLDRLADLDYLVLIPPPDEPRWRAVRDRIWRATRPWPGDGRSPADDLA
jgi:L-threonylcarbamoyladenylate synthase